MAVCLKLRHTFTLLAAQSMLANLHRTVSDNSSTAMLPIQVVVRFGEACDGWPLPAGHTAVNVNDPVPEDKK